MAARLALYHNPRCSKSRQALALLRARGVEPELVEYLQRPPAAAELKRLLGWLGMAPAELARTGEKTWRELGLRDASPAAVLRALVAHPILIERPIAVDAKRGRAVVGRPPERVLELL